MDEGYSKVVNTTIVVTVVATVFAAFGVWSPLAGWATLGIILNLYDISRAIQDRK
jgi:hypothetical protein